MWKNINLERCLAHINAQRNIPLQSPHEPGPAITISRMCGAGGRTVASQLLDYLQPHAPLGCQWTVYDKGLIEKVMDDHLLPRPLAERVPEGGHSLLSELLDKVRGTDVTSAKLVENIIETIRKLAESGYVILVGRAANVITADMKNVFHVRLVGSLERRIERVEEVYEMSHSAAEAYVKAQDAAKRLYLKDYFGKSIDDSQLYHLVVNTDRISYAETARLIGDAFLNWFKVGTPVAVG